MTTNNSNIKGMGHVPGALCLITGIPDIDYAPGRYLNGKVVTLLHLVQPGMQAMCGCGQSQKVTVGLIQRHGRVWQVAGSDLRCTTNSGNFNTAAVLQKYLIPLGDQSLLTDELTAALESKIEAALELRESFSTAYPKVANWQKL